MTIEELESYDTLTLFRCVNCTCINTAWKGSEKYNRIVEEMQLQINYPICANHTCKCHTLQPARIQAKSVEVGKEAPF
jgi:hypothetical protein